MSNNSKILVWGVVAIVLALLGGYFLGKGSTNDTSSEGANVTSGMPAPNEGEDTSKVIEKIVSADTSDTALDQSLASIDVQISQLGIDAININNGFNDKPISQTE